MRGRCAFEPHVRCSVSDGVDVEPLGLLDEYLAKARGDDKRCVAVDGPACHHRAVAVVVERNLRFSVGQHQRAARTQWIAAHGHRGAVVQRHRKVRLQRMPRHVEVGGRFSRGADAVDELELQRSDPVARHQHVGALDDAEGIGHRQRECRGRQEQRHGGGLPCSATGARSYRIERGSTKQACQVQRGELRRAPAWVHDRFFGQRQRPNRRACQLRFGPQQRGAQDSAGAFLSLLRAPEQQARQSAGKEQKHCRAARHWRSEPRCERR